MSSLVDAVARRLRYRDLPDLVGRSLHFPTVISIEHIMARDLGAGLPSAPRLRLPMPEHPQLTVAKYGLLDLFAEVDRVRWRWRDRPGRDFVVQRTAVEEEVVSDGDLDQDLLADLLEDIEKGETWLRLHLEDVRSEEERSRLLPAVPYGADSAVVFAAWCSAPLFPATFSIRRACLTNAESIWGCFYM